MTPQQARDSNKAKKAKKTRKNIRSGKTEGTGTPAGKAKPKLSSYKDKWPYQ